MSYIPRSRVVEPLSDGSITLLILPEQPATIMPIRLWWNGQRVAAADYAVEGDALTLQGDFEQDNFEVDYFVAVASFVPRTARVQGVVTGALTRLTLPELPVDTLPVAVHMGGQRVSLLDYSTSGAVVTLEAAWEGWWFDVDYYISQLLPFSVVPGGGNSGSGAGGSLTQPGTSGGFGGVPSGDYAGSGAMSTNPSASSSGSMTTDSFAGGNIPTFTPDGVWSGNAGEPITPEVPATPEPEPEPETPIVPEPPEPELPPEPSFVPDVFWGDAP